MSIGHLVYVAGPYTHPDPVINTGKMIHIADALLTFGVIPIVPHLTLFWHYLHPRDYEQWLAYDLCVMDRCDAVLRVPGMSSGADKEVVHAEANWQPVIHPKSDSIRDCVAAVSDWLNEKRKP